jgi:hypothetical protein
MKLLTKKNAIMFFILLLVVSILLKPRYLHNIHSTLIGRLLLVAFIVVASMNHILLGLLVGLCVIIVSNMYYIEGMTTIGDDNSTDNTSPGDKINITTTPPNTDADSNLDKEKDKNKEKDGTDRQTIESTIQSKDSNNIQVSRDMLRSGDDVAPSESTTEGFCTGSCAVVH